MNERLAKELVKDVDALRQDVGMLEQELSQLKRESENCAKSQNYTLVGLLAACLWLLILTYLLGELPCQS